MRISDLGGYIAFFRYSLSFLSSMASRGIRIPAVPGAKPVLSAYVYFRRLRA